MSILHYDNSPLIERIEIRHVGQTAQAIIVAPENVDKDKLEALRVNLGAKNFSTLMDSVNGHAAIQVRGIKHEKRLISNLQKLGYTPDSIEKINEGKQANFSDRLRKKSLFLSAIFYDIGNIAFIVSGIQRGRHNPGGKFTSNDVSEILIGGAFSVGDALMTGYGHTRGDEELKAASEGLKEHLQQKGIALPEANTLNPDTLHESGAVQATHRWLSKHIVQIKCLSEIAGGLFTIHSALKPGNRNNGKLAAGLLISGGWLATFMLEKPRGQEIFNKHDPHDDSVAQKVKDNPRGWIARPFAMANNVSNLWGSLNTKNGERTRFKNQIAEASTPEARTLAINRQHDYAWNVVSACSFLIAHSLFGLSGSKRPKETGGDKAMMSDLVLLSANTLSRQPEQTREAAIKETADYVSTLAGVTLTPEQVADAVRNKMTELGKSSWAKRAQPVQSGVQIAG